MGQRKERVRRRRATGEQSDFTLSNTGGGFASVTGTEKTDPGTLPEFEDNSYSRLKGVNRSVETRSGAETLDLTVHWANPDAESLVPTVMQHLYHPYPYSLRVFLTGDHEMFADMMGGR
ncbi:hypothetical protein BJ742DRAFT_779249 [Cladochytrium replicatum]|nr:hypothetical protein BJ742DRAFT_779249 [Cladochytrium replicatum]